MEGERGWRDVSFRPDGGKPLRFGEVSVTFPDALDSFSDKPYWDDASKKTWVRVKSSNISAIPKFPLEKIGWFTGTRPEDGLTYTAVNAKVSESNPGELILEATSLDGATCPMSVTRHGTDEDEIA